MIFKLYKPRFFVRHYGARYWDEYYVARSLLKPAHSIDKILACLPPGELGPESILLLSAFANIELPCRCITFFDVSHRGTATATCKYDDNYISLSNYSQEFMYYESHVEGLVRRKLLMSAGIVLIDDEDRLVYQWPDPGMLDKVASEIHDVYNKHIWRWRRETFYGHMAIWSIAISMIGFLIYLIHWLAWVLNVYSYF